VPGWIGFPELIVLLIVLLLIFGPKRLPEMGRSLGKGMREFKDSLTGKDEPLSLPAPVERPVAVDHTDAQDTVAAPAPRENEPVSH
jgi:sec-independent protein translocase protein TatA